MTTTCSPRALRNLVSQGFSRLDADPEAVIMPPAPRRFSQAIAATFLTTIAVLFAASTVTAALVVSGIMACAASLAAFADVCIASELYHLLVRDSRKTV